MRMDEILNVPQHLNRLFDLDDFDFESKTFIGCSESEAKIYKVGMLVSNTDFMYGLFIDDVLISSIIGYNIVDPRLGTFFCIKDAYTNPDYRRMGYATALYSDITGKFDVSLISGKEQTPNGKALWSSLRKLLKTSIVNGTTGQIYPDDGSIATDKLYVYSKSENNYQIIAESFGKNNIFKADPAGWQQLKGMFHYTHPDDHGKYE